MRWRAVWICHLIVSRANATVPRQGRQLLFRIWKSSLVKIQHDVMYMRAYVWLMWYYHVLCMHLLSCTVMYCMLFVWCLLCALMCFVCVCVCFVCVVCAWYVFWKYICHIYLWVFFLVLLISIAHGCSENCFGTSDTSRCMFARMFTWPMSFMHLSWWSPAWCYSGPPSCFEWRRNRIEEYVDQRRSKWIKLVYFPFYDILRTIAFLASQLSTCKPASGDWVASRE